MKKLVILMTISVCIVAFATSSHALSYDLDVQFSSDGTPPELPPPWLTATFADITTDTVKLTMEALESVTPPPPSGLADNEFVSVWYFNLDPNLNPNNLSFTYVPEGSTRNFVELIFISPTENVAGAGMFDFAFTFPRSGADTDNRFMQGDKLIFDLSGISGLEANSFDSLSEGDADNGHRHTAAHIQAIGSEAEDSGWIGDGSPAPVPEPATLLLLGAGLIGIAGFGRKKLNK